MKKINSPQVTGCKKNYHFVISALRNISPLAIICITMVISIVLAFMHNGLSIPLAIGAVGGISFLD